MIKTPKRPASAKVTDEWALAIRLANAHAEEAMVWGPISDESYDIWIEAMQEDCEEDWTWSDSCGNLNERGRNYLFKLKDEFIHAYLEVLRTEPTQEDVGKVYQECEQYINCLELPRHIPSVAIHDQLMRSWLHGLDQAMRAV